MKRTSLIACGAMLLAASALLLIARAQNGGAETGIRKIDFRNFTYSGTDCAPENQTLTVKDGTYSRDQDDDKAYFEVRDVVYGDLTGDGTDEAVVLTLCNTGGTGQFTDGYIFTMRGAKPVAIGQLGIGDRADGGIYRAEIRNGLLYVDRFGHGDTGGACCPQYVETETFRWNGKTFAPTGKPARRVYQEYLSDDSPAPHVVKFLRGTSSATLVGDTNAKNAYRLGARAGQTLTIRLETKDATAEAVVTTKDGAKLGSVTAKTSVAIKLPATGDVIISLQSTKPSDTDDTFYQMDLTID